MFLIFLVFMHRLLPTVLFINPHYLHAPLEKNESCAFQDNLPDVLAIKITIEVSAEVFSSCVLCAETSKRETRL